MIDKGLLQRMQGPVPCNAFDRGDLCAVIHNCKGQARIDPPSIHENRAGATLPLIAAFFRAGEIEMLAQKVEERSTGVEIKICRVPLIIRVNGTRPRDVAASANVLPFSLAIGRMARRNQSSYTTSV